MLKFHSLRVADVQPDAQDALTICFEVPEELREAYRSRPGQHVVVRAEVDGTEMRGTYSLTGLRGDEALQIAVRAHESGRMSRYLCERLRAGDCIDVLAPNGSFTPRIAPADGGSYVGFAAGVGIAPVVHIARAVLAASPRSRFTLFYGNRTSARTMLLEDLMALKDRYLGQLALHFVMSGEPQETELYNGRIDAAKVRRFSGVFFDPATATECFICGPGSMIEDVSAVLRDLGIDGSRIHAEHFDSALSKPAAQTAPRHETSEAAAAGIVAGTDTASDAASLGFAEVSVLMDGRRRTFTMRMNDETVLDAAANAGLELPFSCRAGVCSTCRTKVTRGEVEMAQNYALEDWELEQGYVLACQSRVTSPVLELDYDEK